MSIKPVNGSTNPLQGLSNSEKSIAPSKWRNIRPTGSPAISKPISSHKITVLSQTTRLPFLALVSLVKTIWNYIFHESPDKQLKNAILHSISLKKQDVPQELPKVKDKEVQSILERQPDRQLLSLRRSIILLNNDLIDLLKEAKVAGIKESDPHLKAKIKQNVDAQAEAYHRMIDILDEMEDKKDPTYIIPSRKELIHQTKDLLLRGKISPKEADNFLGTYQIVLNITHANIDHWKQDKIKNPLQREFYADSFKAWINLKKNDWFQELDRIDKGVKTF